MMSNPCEGPKWEKISMVDKEIILTKANHAVISSRLNGKLIDILFALVLHEAGPATMQTRDRLKFLRVIR